MNDEDEFMTIKELRKSVASRFDQSSSNSGRSFQSICSNYKSRLKGYLCLHWRNYKTILIDHTSWMYCEFITSKSSNSSYLNLSHLLNTIDIQTFNICVEKFTSKGFNKEIYYLQVDLTNCSIIDEDNFEPSESNYFNSEESKLSYMKTRELRNAAIQVPISPTKSYLMRIVHKSSVYSLANSQFKTKLRADVIVDLVDTEDRTNKTYTILLALMSKFLVHYSFLHPDRVYLLKTSSKLNFVRTIEQVFLNETMLIEELINNPTLSVRIKPKFQIKEVDLNSVIDKENSPKQGSNSGIYINMLSGILMEKTLPENTSIVEQNSINQVLTSHFDILFPNKEIKLVIKPKDSNCLLTVYYDTHYSIYPLSILPGMEVKIFNLIRKSPRVYKCNNCVQVSYSQNFDVFNTMQASVETDSSNQSSMASRLYDSLNGLNRIFNTFYNYHDGSISSTTGSFNVNQLSLLFNTNDSDKMSSSGANRQSEYRFLAQLVRIYDFELRVKCARCDRLYNSCSCSQSQEVYELKASFMIDDHTSQLKINYTNSNFDLSTSGGLQSNMFSPIAKNLAFILKSYLNEIQIPTVPVYHRDDDSVDLNTKLNQVFKEKLNSNSAAALGNSVDGSTSSTSLLGGLNESHFFENNVKLDIYKTVYDFLLHTVLDKYFVFYIDPNDPVNSKEVYAHGFSKLKSDHCNFKPKCEFNYVRMDCLDSSEQYKSTLKLKCFKFLPASLVFNA